jgi:hypothetical protein
MKPSRFVFISAAVYILMPSVAEAQFEARWLDGGALHNWYLSTGAERAYALVVSQQYGLRWPAIHPYQDGQATKSLWIGLASHTDTTGTEYAPKVIHNGPRVTGEGSFFPVEMKLISRQPEADVTVYGIKAGFTQSEPDEIDPDLPSERMIYNRVNTSVGLTMERRIYQFANPWHDNYHITEYTFTNTGIVDAGDTPVLPDQVLDSLYIHFQNKYAFIRQTRYTIGNATGWGINTMIDRFGDGLGPDYGTSHIRGHFAWHGRFEPFVYYNYDNLGAPIWIPNTVGGFLQPDDTTGRLAAYHFGGVAVLHADTSPENPTDDPGQPFTMSQIGSDNPLNSDNNPFSAIRMQREYEIMKAGRTPRHAYIVEPSGDFANSITDPALATSGGWNTSTGFGPYSLQPGESITIVMVESVSGLSRDAANKIGRAYKQINGNNAETIPYTVDGTEHLLTKNEWVMTGRDSLMKTFARAHANYQSGYQVPRTPPHPSAFRLDPNQEGIAIAWAYDEADEDRITGFEIHRAHGAIDSTYHLIHTASPGEREWFDAPEPGSWRFYYYIQAIGHAGDNDGTGNTPPGPLASSRYFTQTSHPVDLTIVSIDDPAYVPGTFYLAENYPNPFNPSTSIRFALPEAGQIVLEVFDVTGRRVAVLAEGSWPAGAHHVTFEAGHLSSGVYLYRLIAGNQVQVNKMVLLK